MARTFVEMLGQQVVDGERLVSEQEALLEELQRRGLDTTPHRDALQRYREALAKLRVHLAREEQRDAVATYSGASS